MGILLLPFPQEEVSREIGMRFTRTESRKEEVLSLAELLLCARHHAKLGVLCIISLVPSSKPNGVGILSSILQVRKQKLRQME